LALLDLLLAPIQACRKFIPDLLSVSHNKFFLATDQTAKIAAMMNAKRVTPVRV